MWGIIALVLLCGCTNPDIKVKEVKSRMAKNYHLHMNQHIAFLNSSLENVNVTFNADSTSAKTTTLNASLKKILRKKLFSAIPSAIFQFELSSVGNTSISLKQYSEVRNYTLQMMKDSLNIFIRYRDKKVVNLLVDTILARYSKQFPVRNAYSYYKEQKEYAGTFLQFLGTENEGYCNDMNLLPGDCNWGYIFLAANGKSLFQFQCVGSDSIVYNIGNFEKKNDTLVCVFNKTYSYPEMYDKNTGVSISNPNEGKLSNEGGFTMKLLPCECLQYPFVIRYTNEGEGSDMLQTYVVKVATLKEQDDFIKSIRDIKSIAKMIKN
jgi:hypothetical protein